MKIIDFFSSNRRQRLVCLYVRITHSYLSNMILASVVSYTQTLFTSIVIWANVICANKPLALVTQYSAPVIIDYVKYCALVLINHI